MLARQIAPLAVALALAAASTADAAPGSVDAAFGAGGQLSTPFGPTAAAAAIAAVPGDGFTLAGSATDARGEGVLVARFGLAGALDPTFAGANRLDRFGAAGDPPQHGGAVAAQADGSTLVAGVSGDALMLARYLPDGTLDPRFGAGGVTLRAPPSRGGLEAGSGAAAIAVTPTGQIIVAGATGTPEDPADRYEPDAAPGGQVFVARYSDGGMPDPAFGSDGFSVLQLGAGSPHRHRDSAARGVSLRTDGRIVIVGRASDRRGTDRAFIARLTVNGALDTTFARRGRQLIQLGRASAARPASSAFDALARLADGSLLAAGRATDVIGNDGVLLAHFSAAGQLSGPGFGRGGAYVTQLGRPLASGAPPRSFGRALAIQADGNALVAGSATGGALVARVNATNGRLDCGYGDLGRAVVFGGPGFDAATDGATAALAQPDGAVLLAGRRAGGGVLLARLLGGPSAAAGPATPRLVSLRARYIGRGRAYAYALVDGGCRPLSVRFTVKPIGAGKIVRTGLLRIPASVGPRVVCTPLTRLRAGWRYRIGIVSSAATEGAASTLRAVRRGRPALPQDDCARP